MCRFVKKIKNKNKKTSLKLQYIEKYVRARDHEK